MLTKTSCRSDGARDVRPGTADRQGRATARLDRTETIPSDEYRNGLRDFEETRLAGKFRRPAFFNLSASFEPSRWRGAVRHRARRGAAWAHAAECLDPLGEKYDDAFRTVSRPSTDARLRQVGIAPGAWRPESWADVLAFTMLSTRQAFSS